MHVLFVMHEVLSIDLSWNRDMFSTSTIWVEAGELDNEPRQPPALYLAAIARPPTPSRFFF